MWHKPGPKTPKPSTAVHGEGLNGWQEWEKQNGQRREVNSKDRENLQGPVVQLPLVEVWTAAGWPGRCPASAVVIA